MAKPVLVAKDNYNKSGEIDTETVENYDGYTHAVVFAVREYSRAKDDKGNKKRQLIAFEVEDDEDVAEVKCDNRKIDRANDRLYVDKMVLNSCGERHYVITGKDGSEKNYIAQIVSMIPDEDTFEKMWNDIKRISLKLLFNPDIAQKRKTPGDGYQIEVLKQKVTEVSRIIDALNKEPQRDYLVQEEIIPFRLVKRIDAKTVMDHYVLNKNRVRAKVHIESFDIYENRLIKAYLESLVSELRLLRNDKKVDMDDPESKDIINRDEELEKIEAQIQNLLNKKMFNEITQSNERLHSTNLFVNHPQYKKAYDMIKRNTRAEEIISMKCRYEDVKKSFEIYEIWCFFKILEMLVFEFSFEIVGVQKPNGATKNYRTINDNDIEGCNYERLISLIREEIEKQQASDLYNLMLKLDRDGESIFLAYNYTFNYTLNKKNNTRSPDISLIKCVNGEKRTCIFDAKYQDYRDDAQGIGAWINEVIACATEKHLDDLSRAKNPFHKIKKGKAVPIYSCIVHPNLYDKKDEMYVDNGPIADYKKLWSMAFLPDRYKIVKEVLERFINQ